MVNLHITEKTQQMIHQLLAQILPDHIQVAFDRANIFFTIHVITGNEKHNFHNLLLILRIHNITNCAFFDLNSPDGERSYVFLYEAVTELTFFANRGILIFTITSIFLYAPSKIQ